MSGTLFNTESARMIALEAQATAHGQSSQEKELAVKKNSAKDAALRARTASRALQGLDTSVRSAENPLPPSRPCLSGRRLQQQSPWVVHMVCASLVIDMSCQAGPHAENSVQHVALMMFCCRVRCESHAVGPRGSRRPLATHPRAWSGSGGGGSSCARCLRWRTRLCACGGAQKRVAILQRVADSLLAAEDEILAANEEDVVASASKIDNTLMQRLKLKPAKLQVRRLLPAPVPRLSGPRKSQRIPGF